MSIREVLVATDFSEIADEAVRAARQHAVVCRESSPDLICQPCRARIRGETLRRKQEDERAGRTPR